MIKVLILFSVLNTVNATSSFKCGYLKTHCVSRRRHWRVSFFFFFASRHVGSICIYSMCTQACMFKTLKLCPSKYWIEISKVARGLDDRRPSELHVEWEAYAHDRPTNPMRVKIWSSVPQPGRIDPPLSEAQLSVRAFSLTPPTTRKLFPGRLRSVLQIRKKHLSNNALLFHGIVMPTPS